MKKLILLLSVTLCLNSSAFFKAYSFGVGSLSENVGDIQTEDAVDGETNSLEFNIFGRVMARTHNIYGFHYEFELGSTLPRSSRDEAVTRWNYWFNILMKKDFGAFVPHIGLGWLFTRLSMDGETQYLQNGTSSSDAFATPNGAVVAANTVVIFGTDIYFSNKIFANIQYTISNIEDSLERSSNIFLSLNYNYGSL